MKIKWLGHACFYIEAGGKKIITDPFNEEVGYPLPGLSADLVTVSHKHYDHCGVETVAGTPEVISTPGLHDRETVVIKGVESFHDKVSGRQRGKNIIFTISTEGINLVHLGDLGHLPDPKLIKAIGPVDVLLIPVGGKFTIDAGEALTVVHELKPEIVIPMHYKTPCLGPNLAGLAPVEDFTAQFHQVVKKPYLEIEKSGLNGEMKVIVLDYMI